MSSDQIGGAVVNAACSFSKSNITTIIKEGIPAPRFYLLDLLVSHLVAHINLVALLCHEAPTDLRHPLKVDASASRSLALQDFRDLVEGQPVFCVCTAILEVPGDRALGQPDGLSNFLYCISRFRLFAFNKSHSFASSISYTTGAVNIFVRLQ